MAPYFEPTVVQSLNTFIAVGDTVINKNLVTHITLRPETETKNAYILVNFINKTSFSIDVIGDKEYAEKQYTEILDKLNKY